MSASYRALSQAGVLPSAAVKDITVNYEKSAAELAQQLFGHNVSDEELAAAVGALDGSTLEVSVRMKGQELHVEVLHPPVQEQRRGFRRDHHGELYLWNHRLEKGPGVPGGFGIKVFMRQVAGARKLRVRRIELWAAGNVRDSDHNGYYLRARFGFDAPLSQRDRQLLPLELL